MKFSVHPTPQGYEAKWWVNDPLFSTIFRFEVPENTIYAWRLVVRKLAKLLPNNLTLDCTLFRSCEFLEDIHDINSRKDAILERVTFCKFLLALDREELFSREEFQAVEIFTKNTEITALSQQWPYHLFFLKAIDDEFLLEKERDEQEWSYSLDQAYRLHPTYETISELVGHYDLLREFAYQAIKQNSEQALLLGKNYANLVKAILHFLDIVQQDSDIASSADARMVTRRISQKYPPFLYALLIENETLSLDERREHLDSITAYPMSYEERSFLFQSILADLIEDAQESPRNIIAMQTIASLISQYYLNRYAVDKAVSIWSQTLLIQQSKKDWVLKGLLRLYKSPLYFVIPLIILTLFSFSPATSPIAAIFSGLILFIFITFLLVGLWTISTRFIRKQGFAYLELFLPRLFGSIVVGLSILALESTVWEITLKMPWINWLLVVLAANIGSLAYLFLDIHKNTRLLPDELSTRKLEYEQPNIQQKQKNPITRSVHTTFKIFTIGLLEAFGLTTLVTSLIPFASLGQAFTDLLADKKNILTWHSITIEALSNDIISFQFFGPNGLVLNYFPKVIVFWAGLSLLIGAFVQLLWQDRQITAS